MSGVRQHYTGESSGSRNPTNQSHSNSNTANLGEYDPYYFDEQQLVYSGYHGIPSHPPSIVRQHVQNEYTYPIDPVTPTNIRRQAVNQSVSKLFVSSSNRGSDRRVIQQPQVDTTSPFFASPAPQPTRPSMHLDQSGMPVIGDIGLISIHELPDRLKPIFRYPLFNRMQSKCFEVAYGSDDNLVVSAPTASGKTTILELAICRLATKSDVTNIKVVYVSPTKALCEERFNDWSTRFQQLGMICSQLTGDSTGDQQETLRSSQIIITTPEKWDSITRKNSDQDKLMQMVRLLMIDEVHILNDERGATLEALVSRMKSTKKPVRFVALSATVPNANDVAAWLGKNYKNYTAPANLEVFGEEYRPTQLIKHVIPIKSKTDNEWAIDKICDSMLPAIIEEHSRGRPTMIFCCTRKSCEVAAEVLRSHWETKKQLWPGPRRDIGLDVPRSKSLASAGIAIHHAGLVPKERTIIEQAYLDGNLSVLCCTSTLAVGVNLPCHLVIIKNTVTWTNERALAEYSKLDVMQMLGRAGRRQFGNFGVGVILTSRDKVEQYTQLMQGDEKLESHLHKNLAEHLNAEIALKTIRSVTDAKTWLASTFFFIRLQQNQAHYLIPGLDTTARTDQILDQLCVDNIKDLRNAGVVEANQFKSTIFGNLMAKQYIRLKTMVKFMRAPQAKKIDDVLSVLCSADELQEIKLRQGEVKFYRELGKTSGTTLTGDRNKQTEQKRACIIRAELGGIPIPSGKDDFDKVHGQYKQDHALIFGSTTHRLVRCFVDVRFNLRDGASVKYGLDLSRSLAARAWDQSSSILKQLKMVGPAILSNLQRLGVKSVEDLKARQPHELDRCSKVHLFGTKLLHEARKFPVLHLSAYVQNQAQVDSYPVLHCQADIGFFNKETPKIFKNKRVCVHFLVVRSDGLCIEFRQIYDVRNPQRFSVKLESPDQFITCYVACDEIAGTAQEVTIKPDIPAVRFPKVQSPVTPTPRQSRPSVAQPEDDEFFDDLSVTDLAQLDVEEFKPIGLYISRTDPKVVKTKPMGPSASTARPVPTLPSAFQIKPAHPLPTTTKPVQADPPPKPMSNGRYECNHPCKDKSKCKHLCCREGLDKPPAKKAQKSKPTDAVDTPVGDKPEKLKSTLATKTSSHTTHALNKSKPVPYTAAVDRHKASVLPSKITKPSASSKPVSASLDRLHQGAKGYTMPGLLLKNHRLGSVAQPSPVRQNSDDFGGDFLDDISILDAMEVDMPKKQALPQTIRQPRARSPEYCSEEEVKPYKPVVTNKQSPQPMPMKRKASFDNHSPLKKTRYSSNIMQSEPIATGFKNPTAEDNSENYDHRNSSKTSIDTEIYYASQELAAYKPFDDMEGIDQDFMAQFAGCCEFRE